MKKLLATTKIKRDNRCIYYTSKNEEGYLTIWVSDRKKESLLPAPKNVFKNEG